MRGKGTPSMGRKAGYCCCNSTSQTRARGVGIVVQGEVIDLLRTHGAGALPTTHCTVRRYLAPDGGEGEVQAGHDEV
jgi:hypothetical protein